MGSFRSGVVCVGAVRLPPSRASQLDLARELVTIRTTLADSRIPRTTWPAFEVGDPTDGCMPTLAGATLVSSPLAWCVLDLSDSVPFIQLCLLRSRDADLHVLLHDATSRSVRPSAVHARPINNILAPHFHRIAWLDLQPYSLLSLYEASLLSMLEGPMHRLTVLRLSCMFDFNSPLHLRFNSAHFPQLRTLSLDSLSIDWVGLVLPRLTTLSLTSIPRRRLPTVDAVVDLLEAAPYIREVTILHAGPVLPSTGPPLPRRPVALNCLRTLHFKGPPAQCTALLSRLSIPSNARVLLLGGALHTPNQSPVVPVCMETLTSMLPQDTQLVGPLHAVRFVWLQVRGEWFALRADPKRSDYRNRNPTVQITFESTEDHYDNFLPNALAELPRMFHRSLTSLTVTSGGIRVIRQEQWAQLCASFPHLLNVQLLAKFPFFEELFQTLRLSGGALPWPKLKYLLLGCERAVSEEDIEQMLLSLYDCVEERLQIGEARLAELRIVTPVRSIHWEEHASRFDGVVDRFSHYEDYNMALTVPG